MSYGHSDRKRTVQCRCDARNGNENFLKNIRAGSRVNLERAMSADGRFGGHIVSGHIDGTEQYQI